MHTLMDKLSLTKCKRNLVEERIDFSINNVGKTGHPNAK